MSFMLRINWLSKNKLKLGALFGACLFGTAAFALPKDEPMLAASYVQLDSTASLQTIDKGGIQASNMMIFAFADPDHDQVKSGYIDAIKSIVGDEKTGTVNFMSLGGQTVASIADPAQTISHVEAQIKTINAELPADRVIKGVDLDLENGIPADTILQLAQGFKQAGYLVSIAPQVYTSGGDIDPKNPSNLVLTSGGNVSSQNTYGEAIKEGDVDYIMAQTYNTGGFNVGGYQENQEQFVKAIAEALNNDVTTLNIPATTKILVGEPSNQGAGGQYTIFNPDGVWPLPATYDQAAILKQLSQDIASMKGDANYQHISGFMQWSLNNDFMPNGWGDTQAEAGAFSTAIFGAPKPAPGAYFILQETNTGNDKNSSVTLKVNGQYYAFGQQSGATLPHGDAVSWGSLASSKEQKDVIDSENLDTLFSNGVKSITATVIGNSYNNWQTPISQPDKQTAGQSYTFQAGHSYNVLFNPDTMALEIKEIN